MIIDGRIADICETGFMDGTLVIPQFVLKELQLVADSSDSMKRNRGRRGLDILQKIQKMAGVDVTISDVDFPDVREVDLKLIELARTLQGKIVTNDFNLNKVAQLRGVDVLNINELANSLKPVVLPGEIMKVFILKEGKEYNQGVAYLDDGTMVVVDNARKMISKTIDIVVTSVLQTTAGKMIFGRFIDQPGVRPRGDRASRGEPSRGIQPACPVAGSAPMAPTGPARPARECADAPVALASAAELNRSRAGRLSPGDRCRLLPFHWWRTVFFLIPAIAVYTIVLGIAVARLQPVRSTRLLRARVRAHLVVADPGDHGRRASTSTGSTASSRAHLRLRRESSEHLRHAGALLRRCRISCASSPRNRSVTFRFSAGTCGAPATCWSIARRPDRARIFALGDALTAKGLSLIIFPEGTRSRDGRVGRSRAAASFSRSQAGLPVVPISVVGSRHVMPKGS